MKTLIKRYVHEIYDFLNLKVTSFDLYIRDKKKFHIEGSKITDEIYKEISKLKKGKELLIYNIEFKSLSRFYYFKFCKL